MIMKNNDEYKKDKSFLEEMRPFRWDFRKIYSLSGNDDSPCGEIPYLSDPNQEIQGNLIGKQDEIDNARVVRENADFVSRIY